MKTRSPAAAEGEGARCWTWGEAAQVMYMGFLIWNELIWVLTGSGVLVRQRLGFLRRRELGEVVDMAMVSMFSWEISLSGFFFFFFSLSLPTMR